jgi:hypothetical protein
MQWFSQGANPQAPTGGPLVLLFERNDAIAVPLLGQLRVAGYDVRAARIPVEVFDLMSREPIDLLLIDLGNAAANRREFWVGLDSQRRNRTIHVLTFRYMATGETGQLEEGLRVARADVEIVSANGFGPLIEAVRARLPGVKPASTYTDGPPPNLGLPPASAPSSFAQSPMSFGAPSSPQNPPWAPLGQATAHDIFLDSLDGGDSSPFEQPYSNNPFKQGSPAAPLPPSDPFTLDGNGAGQPRPFAPSSWGRAATPPSAARPATGSTVDAYASAFGAGAPASAQNGNHHTPNEPLVPERKGRQRRESAFNDAWEPPEPVAPPPSSRRGIAYRGYDEEPLAPDDPRIEGQTSPVPAVMFDGEDHGAIRNDRALSTILMDSAVIAPQRLDALRAIQQTLGAVGMDFSISELAMLFKFLTPDQLLAALLVSRGIVTAEEIASLGRIKQELSAAGKDYDLQTLLVMFNILPADEVAIIRTELA